MMASEQTHEEGVMFIRLQAYLAELEAQEANKPPGAQRPIPTVADLARDIGMSHQGLSNIIKNDVKQLSLETGAKIIAAMRARGFQMEVSDLIAYSTRSAAA